MAGTLLSLSPDLLGRVLARLRAGFGDAANCGIGAAYFHPEQRLAANDVKNVI